ncbi:DUF4402 domain-containing protein [Halomonas sp.]|uniref:DUF4402 domain-containing protein n=1 Tax=Halomonas sp. TaxID=1486246 RepID=UPI0025BD7041|nr:DUF4402 domain-containing protein [Halomonas sp.]
MNSSTFIRKNFRLTVLASVVALGALTAANSFAASVGTKATGTVIAPIGITNGEGLNFGSFVAGVAVGTVTVDTAGNRTATGDAILAVVGATPIAAQFVVTGESNEAYGISWAGGVLTNTGGAGETMVLTTVSNLTGAAGATTHVENGILGADGEQTIYMGGTLSVGAAQVAGTYEGVVTATVEYN